MKHRKLLTLLAGLGYGITNLFLGKHYSVPLVIISLIIAFTFGALLGGLKEE